LSENFTQPHDEDRGESNTAMIVKRNIILARIVLIEAQGSLCLTRNQQHKPRRQQYEINQSR
jgi:hypothetical protein